MIALRAIMTAMMVAHLGSASSADIYLVDGPIPLYTDSPSTHNAILIAREIAVERKLRTKIFTSCSNNSETIAIIKREAAKFGVDPLFALAVANSESGCSQTALSSKGAIGTMQLMPQTAKILKVDPYRLEQNISGGIRYLAFLKTALDNNELILAGYNAGIGAVRKYGGIPPYKETINYVKKTMQTYNRLKEGARPN